MFGDRDSKRIFYHFSGSKGFVGPLMTLVSIPEPETFFPISATIRMSIGEKGSRIIHSRASLRKERSPALRSAAGMPPRGGEGRVGGSHHPDKVHKVSVCPETRPNLSPGKSKGSAVPTAVGRDGCSVRFQIAQLTPRYYDGQGGSFMKLSDFCPQADSVEGVHG